MTILQQITMIYTIEHLLNVQKIRHLKVVGTLHTMVGCRVSGRLPHWLPKPMGGMPSLGVFLRDPSRYLREFRRKPRKTPNDKVDNRYRGLNLAFPVYQF